MHSIAGASDHHYIYYIQPQLKKILNGYFLILSKLSPFSVEQRTILDKVQDLHISWMKKPPLCLHKFTDTCTAYLQVLQRDLKGLNSLILELKNKINIKILKNKNHNKTKEHFFRFISLLNVLEKISYKIDLSLDILKKSFFYLRPTSSKKSFPLNRLIDEIKLQVEIAQTVFLEKDIKKKFDLIWVYFFKKISETILKKDQRSYLFNNIKKMTLSWNVFNLNMLKNRKFLKDIIKTMQYQWNSILKILLRK